MINLINGGAFDENLLISHIRDSERDFIIQGQQSCSFAKHTKPQSLDYWLRTNGASNQDTKQAQNEVVAALVETGNFEFVEDLPCPDSNEPCKGIRLL